MIATKTRGPCSAMPLFLHFFDIFQREIRRLAHEKGFRPLADDGLRRVLDGSTSIEEVGRVIDLTERM